MLHPKISNWLSVDPMWEKTMQPYQFSYNNPVRFVDPNGMKADDYIDVDKNSGKITITQAEGDDEVRLVNNGKVEKSYTYGENGSFKKDNSMTRDGKGELNKPTAIISCKTEKLFEFFKFAAQSEVEFSYQKYSNSTNNNKEVGVLSTSHNPITVGPTVNEVQSRMLEKSSIFLLEDWHTHPDIQMDFPSLDDLQSYFVERNFKPDWNGRLPNKSNIYHSKTNTTVIFNHDKFKRIPSKK